MRWAKKLGFGPAEMGKAFLPKQRGGNVKVQDMTDV